MDSLVSTRDRASISQLVFNVLTLVSRLRIYYHTSVTLANLSNNHLKNLLSVDRFKILCFLAKSENMIILSAVIILRPLVNKIVYDLLYLNKSHINLPYQI